MLTRDEVLHIAELARLELSEEEVEKYMKELSAILDFVDQLKEVDTKGIDPTAQVTGQTMVMREDEVQDYGAQPKELLDTSPLPIVDDHISVPSAHK